MNLIWRTILFLLRRDRRPHVGPFDVVRTPFRVLPTDLDIYRHMNNGRYLSVADLGRFDLLKRIGVWSQLQERGWYPVVASSTISYRKSLEPWQRYWVESRFVGVDERSVFLEQRFVVGDEIYARMFLRGRFLKRGGGHVPVEELLDVIGLTRAEAQVPEWLLRWGADVALPSTKQPAPSEW